MSIGAVLAGAEAEDLRRGALGGRGRGRLCGAASVFSRSGCLGGSGLGRLAVCRFNARDERAHRHFVADLRQDLGDGALYRRGHVHRRLVGFERDQRLIDLDDVARLHQHLDDRHVLEVADIGNLHVDFRHRRSLLSEQIYLGCRDFSFAPGSALPDRCRIWRSPRPRAGSAAIVLPPAPSNWRPPHDSGRPQRTSADDGDSPSARSRPFRASCSAPAHRAEFRPASAFM